MEEQLAKATRKELLALVERQEAITLSLQAELRSVRANLQALRTENEALRQP